MTNAWLQFDFHLVHIPSVREVAEILRLSPLSRLRAQPTDIAVIGARTLDIRVLPSQRLLPGAVAFAFYDDSEYESTHCTC